MQFSDFLVEPKINLLILQDGPERMAEDAKLFEYPFPYLYDEVCLHRAFNSRTFSNNEDLLFDAILSLLKFFLYTELVSYLPFVCYSCTIQSQEVAKAFGAVCTPEFFLFKKVTPLILVFTN